MTGSSAKVSAPIRSMAMSDYAGLIALLGRKLQDRELAEDLIQQAYVEALAKLAAGQIRNPELFSGYVYKVAFNLFRNHRRRIGNRIDLRAAPEITEQIPDAVSPFEEVFAASVRRYLREILAELPVERDRELVRRFYLEEDDKGAICAALAISTRHFDKIMFRARRRIRQLLSRRGVGSEDLAMDGLGYSLPSSLESG